eukprot:1194174-Prorocentrum_minimum.AAC.1
MPRAMPPDYPTNQRIPIHAGWPFGDGMVGIPSKKGRIFWRMMLRRSGAFPCGDGTRVGVRSDLNRSTS